MSGCGSIIQYETITVTSSIVSVNPSTATDLLGTQTSITTSASISVFTTLLIRPTATITAACEGPVADGGIIEESTNSSTSGSTSSRTTLGLPAPTESGGNDSGQSQGAASRGMHFGTKGGMAIFGLLMSSLLFL